MNKQELIERYESYEGIWVSPGAEAARKCFLRDLEQLEEPTSGHAEEAPRYVKNVLARLRELPLHDRKVWLKVIMNEFEQDFSHAIWREGYKQGKFEGAWVGQQLKDADKIRHELNKAKVPQMVADWIEVCKENLAIGLYTAMNPDFMKQWNKSDELISWIKKTSNQEIFARAWLDGYEVEREKRYLVRVDGNIKENILVYGNVVKRYFFTKSSDLFNVSYFHTRKELEEGGFGWVFDCPGIEIEEVI